ncbi:hypothetical protein VP01_6707g1 [Puccinia sorghi]|uniref:Uncharacterized protein n=1 Tax=Puccinia sorghi TaxID=27349 RepID=A0A0L6UER7_9BASI|nr:hypothetical protein VP01_6707g1 [Puccinia sorghi]
MIHHYIDKISDVEANGHYAFIDVQKEIHKNFKAQSEFYLNQGFLDEINRVAQRIHVEELGACDIDHCRMSMPMMGHLISWSQTFFPSTKLPKSNPPSFIGLKESQHFVVLKMMDENLFPAAQLEKNWEQIATLEAMQWKNRYLRCFELTQWLKLETGFDKFTF